MTSGFRLYSQFLGLSAQQAMVHRLLEALRQAPLFTPTMPRSGRPLSVQMTSLGSLGWVSDRRGYRYQPYHPENERAWPPILNEILEVWRAVSDYPHDPESCLLNYYREGARMGLHRDMDEEEFDAPVVSISLGDTAVFRLGGLERRDKTTAIKLSSGDVAVMGGPSRLRFHGVDRILPGTSSLLPHGGRMNLTLRRVRKPER